MRNGRVALLIAIVVAILIIFMNTPIVTGDWTKQTFYLWTLNGFHIQKKDARPRILLIDDDSGDGVFTIKRLCDELHMKATFAIIPSQMSQTVIENVQNWQREGFRIALHGFCHDNWRNWTYEEVSKDIERCEEWIQQNGFERKTIKYVVAPQGSNTKAVRKAIQDKGYQMVTGANILNPDTEVFQLGRVMITKDTDLEKTIIWLNKAKKRNLFVILGTHSSMPEEFSKEKTKAVLQMAINMGFEYQH